MTVQEATQIRALWQKHVEDTAEKAAIWCRQNKVAKAMLTAAEAELAAAVLREGGDYA